MDIFLRTTEAALLFADKLTEVAHRRQDRRIPSLLELQTICRETGLTLDELDAFARVLDSQPGLLILGGSPSFVESTAEVFNYKIVPPQIPDAPMVWCLSPGPIESVRIRYGRTDHQISSSAFAAFLSADLKANDVVRLDQTTKSASEWRILWAPHPERLLEFLDGHAMVEVLLSHQAVVSVCESLPDEIAHVLGEHGQKSWALPPAEAEFADARLHLYEELRTLKDEQDGEQQLRRERQWSWLSRRLIHQIDERKQHYNSILDRHAGHMRFTRNVLQQYQKNWSGGIHNLLADFLQSKLTTQVLEALADPKKADRKIETFLSAIAFNNLCTKLEAFMTDKMAEFISGTGAMASKLDLHRISLGDANMRWNTRPLAQACEKALNEKRVFPETDKKRGGLLRNLTGGSASSDENKAAFARAARTVEQCIEREFSEYSNELIRAVEDNIRLQLAGALANAGLAEPEALQSALGGLDRLAATIVGKRREEFSHDQLLQECLAALGGDLRFSRRRFAS